MDIDAFDVVVALIAVDFEMCNVVVDRSLPKRIDAFDAVMVAGFERMIGKEGIDRRLCMDIDAFDVMMVVGVK